MDGAADGAGRTPHQVRYYAEQRDLVATLEAAGITPWVVSASPPLWTEVWAPGIGVPRSRTIGIRTVLEDGRVTTGIEGCGGCADGRDRIMTYVEGKRCWVNQGVLGIGGRAALRIAPDARPLPLLHRGRGAQRRAGAAPGRRRGARPARPGPPLTPGCDVVPRSDRAGAHP